MQGMPPRATAANEGTRSRSWRCAGRSPGCACGRVRGVRGVDQPALLLRRSVARPGGVRRRRDPRSAVPGGDAGGRPPFARVSPDRPLGSPAPRRAARRRRVGRLGRRRKAPARLSPRRLALWSVAGAVAGVAGVVLSAAVVQDAVPFRVAAMAAGLVAGAFIARFTLWWGSVVSSFDMREVLASLCFAFCVQWLPFIAVVFAGAVGKTVLAAALPLCSGWCLRGFEAAGGVPRKTQDSPLGRADVGKPSATGALRARCSVFRSSSSSCGPSTWP